MLSFALNSKEPNKFNCATIKRGLRAFNMEILKRNDDR